MRGATSSLLPSSSSCSETTTTRNIPGFAKIAGVSIFLACSATAAVALRQQEGRAHLGQQQQQQTLSSSSRLLGAATPEAEEWHRLHPGFRDNMIWSSVASAAKKGEEVHGNDDESMQSPFVRYAKAVAKWRVYNNYHKKFATEEIVKRETLLGENDGENNEIHEIRWQDSPVRIDSANILVIVQRSSEGEHKLFDEIKKTLPDATSVVGVTATEWPENIADAQWAIEPIRSLNKEFFDRGWKHPDPGRNGDNLKHLPWLGFIDERNDAGGLTEYESSISHHIGCLFAHLRAWRTVSELKSGKKFSLILEADGLSWELKQLDAIVANVPEDADFVLLTGNFGPDCAKSNEVGFCDKHGNTYPILGENGPEKGQKGTGHFYYWPKEGSGAGFSRYLIGPKFQEKVYKYLARFGADMIDAFTFGHLCQDDYSNEEIRDGGFTTTDGSDSFRKRETSRDEKNYGLKVLNCYVTHMTWDK